jgi:Ca-activated chloride channel homolog
MQSAERERRNKTGETRRWMLVVAWAGLSLVSSAHGAEDPDALYKEGRFAEAQKIYAQSDMDHPKDLRYRYNRGCADYQAGDYKGAMAAFSSVLRRAQDKEIRFRAAYNLGNAAFTQGDAASAAEYYRQAIRIDPNQADARHNLELALRKLEAQKKEKEEKEKSSGKEGEGKESQEEREKEPDKAQEKPASTDASKKDGDSKKDADKKDAEDKSKQAKQQEDEGQRSEQGQEQKSDAGAPQDLSGELKPRGEALPEPSEEPDGGSASVSTMDRKKAEALLDNVTEDRSKFLKLQLPEGSPRGPVSGKDW